MATTTPQVSSGLPQLLRILGTIVAPTTLLTALLFYFGWMHAYFFFEYFGVNSTLLGLTRQDYLMRSIDGLFVPLAVVAAVGLLALWGHVLLRERLVAAARLLVPIVAAVGLALFAIGMWGVFARTVFEFHFAVSPLSLAGGVLLLAYASSLRFPARASVFHAVAEWAGVFVLVGLSLFWVLTDYSSAVGTSRARRLASRLDAQPSVVVFSADGLSLQAPGVRELACEDPDAAYRFRYEGLKLVLQSDDQYLFLPQDWSRADGVAIVLPRSDDLRLEFAPASASAATRRSAC